jgi:hypothetical protein
VRRKKAHVSLNELSSALPVFMKWEVMNFAGTLAVVLLQPERYKV